MSGQKTFFLTGANAKIRINGRLIAFCSNIAYSVSVNHVAPVLLGMYEGSSVEPLSYEVTGSFTIIRYVAGMVTDKGGATPSGVQDRGNGIGTWGPDGTVSKIKAGLSIGDSVDGRAYDNLNPKKLERGTTFDIEIYQNFNGGNESRSVAKIKNCRVIKSDFSLSKRSVAQQTFQFRALYASEDSFLADFSGLGQHLA